MNDQPSWAQCYAELGFNTVHEVSGAVSITSPCSGAARPSANRARVNA